MTPTIFAVLVASWIFLLLTSANKRPLPNIEIRHVGPRLHWNPATPYLKPGSVIIVLGDTSPGYIRRPIFQREKLGAPWCPFPYNCVPGIACPYSACVPGRRCCRSLLGLCCHHHNYTLTHYPPILPQHMAAPPSYPLPVIHYPLPQHKLMIRPPYVPI